jgi:hypothetical protein
MAALNVPINLAAVGIPNLVNASTLNALPMNFLGRQMPVVVYRNPAGSPYFKLFKVPVDLPLGDPKGVFPGRSDDNNVWFYRSTNPTNNISSYDLWAWVVLDKKTNLICNWRH